MKLGKKWALRIASLATTAVVGVGLIVGNVYALKNGNNLDSILCPPVVNTEELKKAQAEGQEMAKTIVAEGSVLLKNDNNVLPLSKEDDSQVNIFGWASVDWAYGANSTSCSGRVVAENDKASELIDLYDALEEYEIEYNTELKSMYTKYFSPYVYAATVTPSNINNNNVITLHEPDISEKKHYSESLLKNAEEYSKTAIVVITRNAGEDIPADRAMTKGGDGAKSEPNKIYLDLSIEEKNLLTYVGGNPNYEKVVVIINTPVAMDLSFLDTIAGLDAALQVGFTGTHGAMAIPELLYGDITPSGHLVDTVAYDRNTSFAMKAKDAAAFRVGNQNKWAFEYIENIYVGYRWYETADAEKYWDSYTLNAYDKDGQEVEKQGYDAVVQYPFGHGLSYTNFTWSLKGYEIKDKGKIVNEITPTSEITFSIQVKNEGGYKGKDVVQVYLTAPYHDGEIEKSFVSLVGYQKTILLEPGKSQVVYITVDVNDCLSYDCYDMNNNGHTGYELDRGDYTFKFMTDSHDIKQCISEEGDKIVDGLYTFNVAKTENVDKDKYTGAQVKNLFTGEDAIDGYPLDGKENGYSPDYLSRSSFAEISAFTGIKSRDASQKVVDTYAFTQAKGNEWDNATVDKFGNPTYQGKVEWGVDYGHKIAINGQVTELGYQLAEDYDDPYWEEVLAQVTVAEAANVINKSYGTPEIKSVGKPGCPEVDGPAQIKCYFQSAPRGTGYPSEVVLAQTWDIETIENFGLSYAKDMNSVGIMGVWAWGANIHRTPVGGRNWEYFSEDPFISGMTLAYAVKGLNNGGKYCYIKHFCLNESETHKKEGFTFLTEQAYREIYLKPFRIAIEQGGALGIMTSFNRIGAVYSGGSEASIAGVVRGEWGFKGSIITDWADEKGSYMLIDQQLRAGGDLGMNVALNNEGSGLNFKYDEKGTARLQYQMKETVHHVLYTWLRSQYLNREYNDNLDPDAVQVIATSSIESWKWWRTLLADADVLFTAGCLLWVALSFLPDKISFKAKSPQTSGEPENDGGQL